MDQVKALQAMNEHEFGYYVDRVFRAARSAESRRFVATVPFTPLPLIKEMFGNVPTIAGRNLDASIAVLYTVEMAVYLRWLGFKNITIITAEEDEKIYDLVNAYKFRYIVVPLDKELNMKFDVVVGNPPFQDDGSQSRWPLFIRLSVAAARSHVALITPNRWCSHGANIRKGRVKVFNSLMKPLLVHANIAECSRHFKAGFTDRYFSYFILDLTKDRSDNNVSVVTPEESFNYDISNVRQIPTNMLTSTVLDITTRLDSHAEQHGFMVQFKKRNKFTSTGERFIVVQSGRFIPWEKMTFFLDPGDLTDNTKLAYVTYTLPVEENVSLPNALTVFKSKLFRFIARIYDPKDEYGPSFFQGLPAVDLTRSWTDEELYNHFNLTQEERDLIEKTIKS